MNEDEIKRLLTNYGDSFNPCAIPQSRRTAFVRRRLAVAEVAFAGTILLAGLVLWPRNAVAGTVARINEAITNARTMTCEMSIKLPAGWYTCYRTTYMDGMWRCDSQIGTQMESTSIKRDGQWFINQTHEVFTTLEQAPDNGDQELGAGNQTALDFAKRSIDCGQVDIERSVAVKAHVPIHGMETYVLAFSRPADNYHAEILVDKKTDLPICSDVTVEDGRPWFKGDVQRIHTDFSFDRQVDPRIFNIVTDKPIIRPEDANRRLFEMWQRPFARAAGTDVRAVSACPDGTIWVIVTPNTAPSDLPDTVTDANGDRYLRSNDFHQSRQPPNPDYSTIFHQEILATPFIPLDPGLPIPDRVTISFTKRERRDSRPKSLLAEKALPTVVSITVKPTIESGDLPSYFPYLGIGRVYYQPKQLAWSFRAAALEESGRMLDAAKAYERTAAARYEWVKYAAFEPMLSAARCYRAAGQIERAEALTKKAEALKASKAR
ncbi:MAG: tetratricopeptide repeat protein [Fimbriimonas sp.]|nr:tetratricopeptide repeat protein [Fimbriimonas sp.]